MKLSRKTELAMVGYLTAALPDFGLTIYAGHSRADENLTAEQIEDGEEAFKLPALLVYAQDAQPHPDLPTETGARIVRLQFQVRVDSSVNNRAFIDDQLSILHDAVFDVSAAQAIINPPAEGDDEREIQGIYLHDLIEANEPSDMDETDWIEEIQADAVVEPAG